MFQQLHRIVRGLAWVMAVLGGLVLTGLILMICLSITGRTMSSIFHSGLMQAHAPAFADWVLAKGIGPIRGDFELVEASMAAVIFAFLVWCQVTSGHAAVDIFTQSLRGRPRHILQALIEIGLAVALVLIAIKLHEGMDQQQRRRTTTFVLQFPLWWSYLAAVIPAYIAAGVACYMALVRIAEAALGRPLIPTEHGAEH